jgi:hypothetical protein
MVPPWNDLFCLKRSSNGIAGYRSDSLRELILRHQEPDATSQGKIVAFRGARDFDAPRSLEVGNRRVGFGITEPNRVPLVDE